MSEDFGMGVGIIVRSFQVGILLKRGKYLH